MTSWIPYGRQQINDQDIAAVVQVLKSDWLTTGPAVEQFETRLARRCAAKFAVTFNSGTSALHAAYQAAGVSSGDEVITSPISFVATANAALYLGATPVFADVQEDTVNIDPQKIKAAISDKTKVIAPVDFAGHPADLDEIMDIARERGAIVIEDACHALGATYKGRPVGSIADMTVFSFHPVKGITTGEGGAVVTNDDAFYEKLLILRNHGITKDRSKMIRDDGPWYYEMHHLGYNYRLSDIQCALGLSQLDRLDKFIARRRRLAQAYDGALASSKVIRPVQRTYVQSAWHLYTVQLRDPTLRSNVVASLHSAGIGVQVHYIPIYHHPYYQAIGYASRHCPNAETYYSRCLSLPLFPGITKNRFQHIIERFQAAVSSH